MYLTKIQSFLWKKLLCTFNPCSLTNWKVLVLSYVLHLIEFGEFFTLMSSTSLFTACKWHIKNNAMLLTLYLLPLSRKQANVDKLYPIFKNNCFQPEKLVSRTNETDFPKST